MYIYINRMVLSFLKEFIELQIFVSINLILAACDSDRTLTSFAWRDVLFWPLNICLRQPHVILTQKQLKISLNYKKHKYNLSIWQVFYCIQFLWLICLFSCFLILYILLLSYKKKFIVLNVLLSYKNVYYNNV